MASHLCDLAKQWWCVPILQRWSTAHSHQGPAQRIHHSRRRFLGTGPRTRFSWRRLWFQPALPRVFDQCERVVLRPFSKFNQEEVEVLHVRVRGERVQVVRLHLWNQGKSRSCHSISLLTAQYSEMITRWPQTHCCQSFQKMAREDKTIIIVTRESQLWRFSVKCKAVRVDEPWTWMYKDQNKNFLHSKCLFVVQLN